MDWTWLEGQIAVEAALMGNFREVENLYVRRGKWKRGIVKLMETAERASIPVNIVSDDFFAEHASGKSHGGVIAKVGLRRFQDGIDLLGGESNPLVVMLDGIEDPYNFGQAVRSLYAAGVCGLVVRPRNWFTASNIIARASAGTSELIPTAIMETTLDAARFFRENGLQIACTAKSSTLSLFDGDLTRPMFIVIGGEKRGITRSFMDQADLILRIPYGRQFAYSLGAVSSTTLIAYEAYRQRRLLTK